MAMDPALEALRQRFRAFLDNDLKRFEDEAGVGQMADVDADTALTRRARHLAREAGFYGINLPVAYGGQGLGVYELSVLQQELMRSGRRLWGYVLGYHGGPLLVGHLLLRATGEQKQRYLTPLASGDALCALAISEPEAGSDAGSLQTTATRVGDSYVLSGTKYYISNASYADFAIIVANTIGEDGAATGVSAFLVDRDAPGYVVGLPQVPMSGETIHAPIKLDNCRVPAANLLGQEGQGFRLAMGGITQNRLLNAANYLGTSQRLLDLSLHHATHRVQFKQPIAEFQAVQHMLADMATEIYATTCMVEDAARAADRGEDVRDRAAMAKLFASEVAGRVADRAVQIHGGAGLMRGHPVEELYRSVRAYRILTGTSEIQRNVIAKGVLRGAAKG